MKPTRRQRRIDRFAEARASLPVDATITHLTPSPRELTRITVRINKLKVAQIHRDDADALRLVIGMAWTPELSDRVLAAQAKLNARTDALLILSRRAVSHNEMVRKLQRKEHARALSEAIADELVARGAIDDERYAQAIAASLTRGKPAGARLISAKLAQRGIARSTADKAARDALQEHDPVHDATELAKKRLSRMSAKLDKPAIQRRLFGLLARRGFDPDVCAKAVRSAMAR